IERVHKTAKAIALKENADVFITELGALLHDIADHKFVKDHENETVKRINEILREFPEINETTINKVLHIVLNCSFKGGIGENKMQSLEGKIVQDADRLDAIGAIGIARTFAYGGNKNQSMYDPELKSEMHDSFEEYAKAKTSTINHFYEKLLLLKDRLNTDTAKEIGLHRHQYMERFLEEFFSIRCRYWRYKFCIWTR
ncbi:MAG: HD domain-containing protein, partial [Crocinitomicaceae bacterium]